MQLKKDDNSFSTNQPNNYPPNPPFNMPDNQPYMQNPMDYDMGDTYKQNNVNAFENLMSDYSIIVPSGSKSTYIAETNWSSLADHIVEAT